MKRVWHDRPDEAVKKSLQDLETIRKCHSVERYWEAYRHLVLTDPWFLMRVVLEIGWLDEDLIGHKFCKHIVEFEEKDKGILLPRGHGKTLPKSVDVIQKILRNPNTAILEISRTDDNAKKIGSFIADHLLYNSTLQKCFGRKYNKKTGFLPETTADTDSWGKDGYILPWRKPRIDPTLLCISLSGAKAGKHPEEIWIDDPIEKENNSPAGYATVEETIKQLWFLLPPHGIIDWTGTRWGDADPIGKAIKGHLKGKQGPFCFIQESCYVDDDPAKGPTYPLKIRWDMDKATGYDLSALEAAQKPEPEGMGDLFDAQMRNDPVAKERTDIKVSEINIYDIKDKPSHGPVLQFGIETTGGGKPIYNGFVEYLEQQHTSIPLVEIENPRSKGNTKKDRIVTVLQPLISSGRFHCPQWMIGDASQAEGLGYELRRLGKASHDDIADAIHNTILHLVDGSHPPSPDHLAELYIGADIAWTDEKRSDWSVIVALTVDHKKNIHILDYDRFQIASPTGIYNRLLAFYKKFENEAVIKTSRKKFAGTWR